MTEPGKVVQSRLRGHVGGANWRPTWLAEEVPIWNSCGLCRMIPQSTVQLPCLHILCESCLGASTMEGAAVCPFDLEPFSERECKRIILPGKKSGRMKAYCWNEADGCKFVGTMAAVLHHYEKKCTFHALACPWCGVRVLHKELPKHYMAGCTTNTCTENTMQAPFQSDPLPLPYALTSLEERQRLLRHGYHHQLPATRHNVNELLEHSKMHTMQLTEIAARLRNTETNTENTLKHVARNNSSPSSQSPASQQHSATNERRPGNEATSNEVESARPVQYIGRVPSIWEFYGPIAFVLLLIVSAALHRALLVLFFPLFCYIILYNAETLMGVEGRPIYFVQSYTPDLL